MFGAKMRVLCVTLLLLASLATAAPAQDQKQEPQEREPMETLKVNVNVVNLFFNVKDKRGALIPELSKEDFNVIEDGKPQTIKYFSRQSDQPLTLGILVDASASQTMVLGEEQIAGAEFLQRELRSKDLAFLISFDVNVSLEQDFTSDPSDLRRALRKIKINSGGGGGGIPGIGQGPIPQDPKGTLLYDAIYLAADEKLKQEVGRKAMILLTDGQDQGSRLNIREAIEAAQKSDTICYVIEIADRGAYSSAGLGFDLGPMKKLVEETGGRMIEVGNNTKKLRDAFDQIASELRTQYNIGYTPVNQTRNGAYRKVEVHPKNKDFKVQARKGYYAPKD